MDAAIKPTLRSEAVGVRPSSNISHHGAVTTPSPLPEIREQVCGALALQELRAMAGVSSGWRQSALASLHAGRPPTLPGFELRTPQAMQLVTDPQSAWSTRLRNWRFYRWDNSHLGAKLTAAVATVAGTCLGTAAAIRSLSTPQTLACSRIPGDTCRQAASQIVANARFWGADWSSSRSRCLNDLLRFCGYSWADAYLSTNAFYYRGNPQAPDVTWVFGDPQQHLKSAALALAGAGIAVGLLFALNHGLTLNALHTEARSDASETRRLTKLRAKNACCLLHPKQWLQQRRLVGRLVKAIEQSDAAGVVRLLTAGAPVYLAAGERLPLDVANALLAEAVATGDLPEVGRRQQVAQRIEDAAWEQREMLQAQLAAEPETSPYRATLHRCLNALPSA